MTKKSDNRFVDGDLEFITIHESDDELQIEPIEEEEQP